VHGKLLWNKGSTISGIKNNLKVMHLSFPVAHRTCLRWHHETLNVMITVSKKGAACGREVVTAPRLRALLPKWVISMLSIPHPKAMRRAHEGTMRDAEMIAEVSLLAVLTMRKNTWSSLSWKLALGGFMDLVYHLCEELRLMKRSG
jgi:hypothetical protein